MSPFSKAVRPPVPPLPVPTLAELLERLELLGRFVDRDLIGRAYAFAQDRHGSQLRHTGEPFLHHLLAVAGVLVDFRLDSTSVAVGLLHDVLEDTGTQRQELEAAFGAEIAELVDAVTKIGRHTYVRRDEAQAETFRKMILASARDLRVILVKLADRLHNMTTLDAMAPESRRRIAQETIEIYAPIAHRLGMAKVKGDLEDLAFSQLYPLQFASLREQVEERLRVGKRALSEIRDRIAEVLLKAGIEADISHRVKRYYSIYQKLRRQGVDISELYDYLAFRVIVAELKDCYATLGILHQYWRPLPGRIKDYIAMPKPNLYRSLHTTLLGPSGQPFEVQIRTREMDLIAEEGVAAHWRYKEGRDRPGMERDEPEVRWLRQLLELHTEQQDPRSFLSGLKLDLYPDEIYVFSPKGDVYAFPRGATPLDFAYRIHTDIGHRCSGSRVNGRLVPLRTELKTGDVVEILTQPGRHPSRDWLSQVVTSRAKSKIRHWLNTQQTAQAIEIGKKLFERELQRQGQSVRKVLDSERFRQLLAEENLARAEDLFARIGYGKTTITQVFARLLDPEATPAADARIPGPLRQAWDRLLSPRLGGPVPVQGPGDLLTVLARCCRPVPGDEIIGFITRGRGISVHTVDCPNVRNLLYNPERQVDVTWSREDEGRYLVTLRIETEDRQGMLARLTDAIARLDTNIRQIEADTDRPGRGDIEVVIEVKNRKQLERVKEALRNVPGVLEVTRSMAGVPRMP